ncbi:hypothetical protein GCM10022288_00460 [Gryllotalpicola kribbensis]|jgi:hypothetical protein|uniref:Mucin-associated surface protein n=2 Tax=Gryllotalpicola kribbensis TaxID=993084 RepID=A0ABP8AEH0_9MICO
MTLALAGALVLTGCTSSGASKGATSTISVPTTTATSAAQVATLNDAVAYALTVTPKTPLTEIDQAGRLLKKYADASSELSADDKSAVDGFIAQSQQAVAAKDETSAGADLQAAAQGVAQALAEE